ncbi:cytochrome c1 [Spartinivicinus poritis]|uniref:Cytochrome c1 n=1 Tax=Spartinivicinus poritis TaxID=2994640 RepID=A0ABT5U8T1_9GAMM|nr:cytochrome c1 [Spartinivicinus sp. A2-2]MDE1462773.1 cytochrome c1 [Spartinivicinus sp. A2-2]
MKKLLVAFLMLLPVASWAAGGSGFDVDGYAQKNGFKVDLTDKAALQQGLSTYMNYCMGCHSTKYQRYERVADDLGIPHELMMENVVFNDVKIGNLMENAMRPEEAKKWFGAAPPDLTLVARVRGPNWLYAYLRTFYEDKSRPWGVNNKVFPDVAMPHVLLELQGLQHDSCYGQQSHEVDTQTGKPLCELTLKSDIKHEQTPEEYDQTVRNLVSFLAYAGEPARLDRERIGTYVLLFLAVFFVFAYLLKREFWKDVH